MQAIDWRPVSGSEVVLSDSDLSRIGLIAVLEAQAKSTLEATLKGLEGLTAGEWQALERVQFVQLTARLISSMGGVSPELAANAERLEELRDEAQDLRHAVVHAMWAIGPEDEVPAAYDVRRKRWLSRDDIERALLVCGKLSTLSKALLIAVAELVVKGRLSERASEETGVSVQVGDRLVQF